MNIKKTIDFTNLSPETLVEVFKKHQVTFPRSLRVEVLLTLLEPKYIEERNKIEKQKEEAESTMNIKDFIRLNRLVQYNSLSEFQLENDFTYYDDVNLNKLYFNTLWDKFVKHLELHPYCDDVFQEIEQLEIEDDLKMLSVFEYNKAFASIITDEDDYFDGIHLVESVRHFNDSSVATEIKQLGNKYDITIPKYWTKADLQARLKKELKLNKLFTKELETKIDESSTKITRGMLDDLKVDSKLHITKTDMINIIIKNVDKNKVSEISKKELAEEIAIAEITEVIEPVIEKVIEEPVVSDVVEALVVQNTPGVDYTNMLQQIIDNQNILIEQTTNKEMTSMDKVFNYIVIGLIIVVVLIWLIYGIATLV